MKLKMQPFYDRNEQEIYINVNQITAVRKSIWGDHSVIEVNGTDYEIMNSVKFILESIEQGETQ